jgi:hypothetical protein
MGSNLHYKKVPAPPTKFRPASVSSKSNMILKKNPIRGMTTSLVDGYGTVVDIRLYGRIEYGFNERVLMEGAWIHTDWNLDGARSSGGGI